MSQTILILVAIIICAVVGFVALYSILNQRLKQLQTPPTDATAMTMLNQNIQGMQERLDVVSSGLNSRLDNAAKVIGEVNKELGQVQEIGRSMRDLQNFLKSPKLRGNLGEQVLKDLLSQHFPQNLFEMQYKFSSGDIVDAALKTDNGIIGIDAKFPLVNFEAFMSAQSESDGSAFHKLFIRDVRKHISDIAKKYVVPEEGTVNFALMYIPSESVYYEIIRHDTELSSYAQDHKVLMVSPNSFYYFIKVILTSMQGKKIEAQAQSILGALEGITKDVAKFGNELGVLTTHLTNAKSALDRTTIEYTKLAGKIDQIRLLQ